MSELRIEGEPKYGVAQQPTGRWGITYEGDGKRNLGTFPTRELAQERADHLNSLVAEGRL